MRLFVALELPEGERRRLAELPKRYRWTSLDAASLNWTREQNLHITVKFLGAVEDDHLSKITGALGQVQVPTPIELRVDALTFMPPRGPIRIFAGQIGGDLDQLSALHAGIELAVEPLGFAREQRQFSPHVTLARPRRERRISGEARAEVAEHQPPPGAYFAVEHFVLMNSDLSSGGPRYAPVARFPLRSTGGGEQ